MDMPGEVDAAIEILRNKGARSPRPTMCLSEGSPILSAGFGDFVLPVQVRCLIMGLKFLDVMSFLVWRYRIYERAANEWASVSL